MLGWGRGSLPSGAAGQVLWHDGEAWTAAGPGPSGSVMLMRDTASPMMLELGYAEATPATDAPTYSGAPFVAVPEMSVALTPSGMTSVAVLFAGTFSIQSGDEFFVALFRDGVEVVRQKLEFHASTGVLGLVEGSADGAAANLHYFDNKPTAAAHTYEVRWSVVNGTARAVGTLRALSAIEVLGGA